MSRRMQTKLVPIGVFAFIAGLLAETPSQAIPAFADQTGFHCAQCHVGAFGPQLTPTGRIFKLGGYTLRTNWDAVPLALMAVGSFVHTTTDQVVPPAKN